MDNKIKYLTFMLLLIFLLTSYSHTFRPYSFSISFPKKITTKLNEEIHVSLVVKNLGMLGDHYNLYIIPSTKDIFISYNYTNFSLEPLDSKNIPITIIVYSSLGNKVINVTICSLGLLNNGFKDIMLCSLESCEILDKYGCISSELTFLKIESISLGNSFKNFIIFPLFLIIFVILLGFAEHRHRKLYNGHHH